MDLTPPEEDEGAAIIPIRESLISELEISKKKRDKERACIGMHKKVEVDEVHRLVICRDCGFTLDPFDYLMDWATEGDRRMGGLKGLSIQSRVLEAEHSDLKRRIDNARAVLKRLGFPQSEQNRLCYKTALWNPHQADKYLDQAKKEGDELAAKAASET